LPLTFQDIFAHSYFNIQDQIIILVCLQVPYVLISKRCFIYFISKPILCTFVCVQTGIASDRRAKTQTIAIIAVKSFISFIL